MSESETKGRTRRRAVRRAGPPPAEDAQPGATPSEPTVAVVDSAAAPKDASTSAERNGKSSDSSAAGVSDSTQPDGAATSDETVKADGAAASDKTVKLDTAAASDETVKLDSPADDTTVKLDSAAVSDETGKLESPAETPRRDAGEAELWKPTAVPADAGTSQPATASEPVDAESGTSGESGTKHKLGWIGWIAAAVAAVSALVLIGSGGFLIYHQQQVDAAQQQRDDYTQTAKQVVLNLTNISGDTAPKDIDRVLSVASGQLKAEYSERKDAYAQVVQQAKVKASGEIIESALESSDDHSARVLVAAKQTLTNAGTPDPQQRYYRFRVTVTRDDDGHLTGSQVEFVA